tara:strand:+ start:204 stop:1229 length:1026 start_codon:yes stop_codon:yes gene_type:complete
MTFFNKKEEVMKIELTPYGRYLLSIGKLKPHSYRFFDDNVMYDSSACEQGGTHEEQNMSHIRISSETPILKMNPNITGVETNISFLTSKSAAIKDMRDPIDDDQLTTNSEAMGTCAYEGQNGPAMALDVFGQKLDENNIKNYYSSSSGRAIIPQIPVNMFISASAFSDINSETFTNNLFSSYTDGTGYSLNYEPTILRLREFNGFDEKDNFTITAYKVEKNIASPDSKWRYRRLRVDAKLQKIVEGMLVLQEEEDPFEDDASLQVGDNLIEFIDTTDELSYYISLTMDRQIPDAEICKKVQDYEIENIFLDDEIICPDPEFDGNIDIYGTGVDPSDLEDCD